MSLQFLQPYFGLGNGLQTKNAGGGVVGGWVELGRTTLGSASDTITVSSLANKRYYMLLQHNILSSSNCQQDLQFGSGGTPDTGSNYSTRQSDNGSEGTSINQLKILTRMTEAGNTPGLAVSYIANISTKEKLILGHSVQQNTAGAGTAPFRGEWGGKWVNTSNALNVIKAFGTAGGTMDANSEVVVLGWDPADTHSNNFWTEIGSSTTTGGTTLDITLSQSKKYNWVQLLGKTSAGTNPRIQLGNGSLDTANNYSDRYSVNGGADSTEINISGVAVDGSGSGVTNNFFINAFIINSPTKEKLIFGSLAHQNTAGAGTAPTRDEFVGKWSNTSVQFNHFGLIGGGGATFTVMDAKVWGAD